MENRGKMRKFKDSVLEGQIGPKEVPEREDRKSRRKEITKEITQGKFLALQDMNIQITKVYHVSRTVNEKIILSNIHHSEISEDRINKRF